jgi:hypothetical protein
MRKHNFSPTLDSALEERLALSSTAVGTLGGAHAHLLAAKPAKHPVVTAKQVSQVNVKVDSAFNEFNREYSKELRTLGRTGNHSKFDTQFAASVKKLRNSLAIDANRLPFGKTSLNPALQARVDSLVSELKTNTSADSPTLIAADRSGANSDVSTFIHDEATKGDISLK